MFKKIKEFILDIVFPKTCFGCGKEGKWFCESCEKKIKYIKTQTCYLCKRISKQGRICPKCRKHSNLNGILVVAKYEGIIKEALAALKYEDLFDVNHDLSKLMISCLEVNKLTNRLIIIPIPLHKKKIQERGYNQSELLAKNISLYLDFPLVKDLLKIKNTPSQVGQKGTIRRKNLLGAFAWKGNNLKSKNILIVDDVLTTGSTLEEAAKVLRAAGANKIWAIVISKSDLRSI